MAFADWKYQITAVTADPSNANIVATVNFWNSNNPATIFTRQTFAFDLSDATIAAWAANVITTLDTRATKIGTITMNKPLAPSLPAPSALVTAQGAFQTALLAAQVASYNNAALTTAYNNLIAAGGP